MRAAVVDADDIGDIRKCTISQVVKLLFHDPGTRRPHYFQSNSVVNFVTYTCVCVCTVSYSVEENISYHVF